MIELSITGLAKKIGWTRIGSRYQRFISEINSEINRLLPKKPEKELERDQVSRIFYEIVMRGALRHFFSKIQIKIERIFPSLRYKSQFFWNVLNSDLPITILEKILFENFPEKYFEPTNINALFRVEITQKNPEAKKLLDSSIQFFLAPDPADGDYDLTEISEFEFQLARFIGNEILKNTKKDGLVIPEESIIFEEGTEILKELRGGIRKVTKRTKKKAKQVIERSHLGFLDQIIYDFMDAKKMSHKDDFAEFSVQVRNRLDAEGIISRSFEYFPRILEICEKEYEKLTAEKKAPEFGIDGLQIFTQEELKRIYGGQTRFWLDPQNRVFLSAQDRATGDKSNAIAVLKD